MSQINLDRRRFFLLGGTAALAIGVPSLLSACGAPATSGATGGTSGAASLGKTQVQALGGGLCGSPSYIAQEKGFWAEQGIDVELVSGTFQQQKDGLASGQYLVANGDFQFFPAVEQGLDLKIIGGMHTGCIKLLVPGDSPITSVAGLKGKKIGVDEIGGTPWAVASVALGDAGIDPSESAGQVTFAPYDLTTLEEVAKRGEVDAIAAWDPQATIAENNGFRVLVDISSHPLFAGRFCCFLYASGAAVNDKPETVAALLRGWYKAIEWIAENPEETARIVTDSSQHEAYVPSEDQELLVTLLKSYHYKNHASSASSDSQARDDALFFVGKLKDVGYLSSSIDTEQFVDNLVVQVDL
ncbi:ABC transporter substrate-binding protein [Propionicicella superfundia]|uniref:ABC transporter substrate-binding protein n=1 Tax=Propionicicella superfundia TaxID=348582 RepID=UPI0003F967D8|nr:ABC transporter substrate-binding protein [Propionicicella superfundia]